MYDKQQACGSRRGLAVQRLRASEAPKLKNVFVWRSIFLSFSKLIFHRIDVN